MKNTIALLTLGLSLTNLNVFSQQQRLESASTIELQEKVNQLQSRFDKLQHQYNSQQSVNDANHEVIVHKIEQESYKDLYEKLDELQVRLNQLYLKRNKQFQLLQKNIQSTTKQVQSEHEADSLLILVKNNQQAIQKTANAAPPNEQKEYLELSKKLEEQIHLLETYRKEDKEQFSKRYDSLQNEIKNMNNRFHEKIDHEYERLRDYNRLDTLQTKLALADTSQKEVKETPATPIATKVVEKIVNVPAEIPDNDKDGILNDIDKCPNVFGTLKNEGCPQAQAEPVRTVMVPAAPVQPKIVERIIEKQPETRIVEVEKKINFLAQSIFFKTNSDSIQGISQSNLNQIVGLMQQFPNSNFVIAGHTDSVGNAVYNKTLSQKRAQAVVAYLIQKGIQPNQLVAVGYGEELPIASNNTAQGREQNRRVEIKIK